MLFNYVETVNSLGAQALVGAVPPGAFRRGVVRVRLRVGRPGEADGQLQRQQQLLRLQVPPPHRRPGPQGAALRRAQQELETTSRAEVSRYNILFFPNSRHVSVSP